MTDEFNMPLSKIFKPMTLVDIKETRCNLDGRRLLSLPFLHPGNSPPNLLFSQWKRLRIAGAGKQIATHLGLNVEFRWSTWYVRDKFVGGY